mgnify:FL=1
MKRSVIIAVAILVSLITFVIFQVQDNSSDVKTITGNVTAFTHVNVIPMTSEVVLEDQTVVISNGIISSISPSDNVKLGDEVTVIDGTGKFLLPGLAEMHGHVPPVDPPSNAPRYMDMEYVENNC